MRDIDQIPMIDDEEDEVVGTPTSDCKPLPSRPPDRLRRVWWIFLLHGLAALTPWNMFVILAWDYFKDFKLSLDYTKNSTESNLSHLTDEDILSKAESFPQILTFISQIPDFTMCVLNCFIQWPDSSLASRVVASLVVAIICILGTIVMALVDTSTKVNFFIAITFIIVIVINASIGVYQNSVFGLVAKLPMKYVNSVIMGNNISGLTLALLSILSKATTPDMQWTAVAYFSAASVICASALFTICCLPHIGYYKYFNEEMRRLGGRDCAFGTRSSLALEAAAKGPEYLYTLRVFKEIARTSSRNFIDVFISFYVTLLCFPGIVNEILPISPDQDLVLGDKSYFHAIYCFVFFNLFSIVGNILTEIVRFPGPKKLWIFTWGRLIFVPTFLFMNYLPNDRTLPVLFSNSYIYAGVMILFSLSNGYVSSLSMMYAPREIKNPLHVSFAGMLSGVCLLGGVFCGCATTMLLQLAFKGSSSGGLH